MRGPRSLAAVLLAGLVALPLMGCEIAFSVTEDLPVHTISGGALPLPIDTTWSMSVSDQSEYQSRSFDHIKEIWIRDLVLEIQDNGSNETFEFLTSVEINVTAVIDGTSRSEIVAWVPAGDPQVQAGSATDRLKFRTTNVELLPFIEAEGGYQITVEYSGSAPDNDIDVGGFVQYRLKVGR